MSTSANYAGPLIDAHHHLWSLGQGAYPWLEEASGDVTAIGDLASLRIDYLPDDFKRDLYPALLVGSVHVEALHRDPHEEICWLESLQAQPTPDRYVTAGQLEAPEFGETVSRLRDQPRIVGVRSVLSWHPDATKSFVTDDRKADRSAWRRGVDHLCRAGLILELMLYPYQADQVARVARDFPDLTIIVNHCASPIDQDAVGLCRWRDALDTLAAMPNILIKASNPGVYVGGDADAAIATVRQCVRAFGYDRAMFGSDLPVARLHVAPASIMATAQAAVATANDAQRDAFFYHNAKTVYQITGG
jgi:predicted TIM-barrel fold metal-dependent hydrolase